jgi:hypothetical protein
MPITFACPECDKTFKVSDEMAGRKGKCNGCGATMLIPGKVRASSSSNGSAKSRDEIDDEDDRDYEDEPRSRARRRRDDDDDYEVVRTKSRRQDDDDLDDEPEEEERPRRKKKRKKKKARSLMGLWVSLGIVSTLTIMGAAYFAVAFALNIWPFGGAGEAMKFMPDNCKVLISVKWDEIEKSQLFNDLKNNNPSIEKVLGGNSDNEMQFFRKKGIDSLLIGFNSDVGALTGGTPKGCLVATVKESTTGKEALDAHKDASAYKESKIGSYTMYENSKDAFSVVSSKMIVLGDKDVVSAVLKRDKKPELSEGLKAAMDQISFSKALAIAADTKGALTSSKMPMLQMTGVGQAAEEIEGFALQASVTTDLSLDCFLICKSAKGAEDLKKKYEDSVKEASKMGAFLPKEATELMNSVKVSTSGGNLNANVTISGETIKGLAKNPLMAGGLGGPPAGGGRDAKTRTLNPGGAKSPSGGNTQPTVPGGNRPGGGRPGGAGGKRPPGGPG